MFILKIVWLIVNLYNIIVYNQQIVLSFFSKKMSSHFMQIFRGYVRNVKFCSRENRTSCFYVCCLQKNYNYINFVSLLHGRAMIYIKMLTS